MMTTQNPWLFEAPLAHEVAHYANYNIPQLEFEWAALGDLEATGGTSRHRRRSAHKAALPLPFFKDSPLLNRVPLASSIVISRTWPTIRRELAKTYNRVGGLIRALAKEVGIDVPSVLAVWHIESGGQPHTVGFAIIRFENHKFYEHWGKYNASVYNQHFRFDPNAKWKHHQFRENTSKPFQNVHDGQAREYQALNFAIRLAGENPALQSISIGGPQILGENYRTLGYSSPREMYDAFQHSERAHVLGFFDFCLHAPKPRPGDLMRYLHARQWQKFAKYYNGPGQVTAYAKRFAEAYSQASHLTLNQGLSAVTH